MEIFIPRVWPDKFCCDVELFPLISGDSGLAIQNLQEVLGKSWA